MYPSEYAYLYDSVNTAERVTANCRKYQSALQAGVFTEQYIHCDGNQLKLADSILGQEQFQRSEYYVRTAGSDRQLLFIFPTRVSLTTLTLHFYSDSIHGLPRLRFYAVSHHFDVWDTPATNYPQI